LSDPSIYRTSPATNLFVAVHCTFAPKKFFAASNTDVTVWSVFGHCKKKVRLGAGFAGAAIAANLPNARLRTRSMPLSERRARRARPFLAARRPPWMRRASLATCALRRLARRRRRSSARRRRRRNDADEAVR